MKYRYSRMLAALVMSAVMIAGCGNNQQQAGEINVIHINLQQVIHKLIKHLLVL